MLLDEYVFLIITNVTLSSGEWRAIAFMMATLLIWFLVIWYAVVAIWHKRSRIKELLALILGGSMVYLFNIMVSIWWWRPRPFVIMDVEPIINVGITKSFPSDHAAIAFFLAYLLFKYKKKWWWFFIISALVALGRVAAGVHYPLDVVAGSAVGLMFGYLTTQVERLFVEQKS